METKASTPSDATICQPLRYCPRQSRLGLRSNRQEGQGARTPRRAAFIDRDGVIVEDVGYLTAPDQLNLLPRSIEGLRLLQDHYLIVMITNQSAVARGLLTEKELLSIHKTLTARLSRSDVLVDAIYACPHHPTAGRHPYRRQCRCRKPQPGMLLQASVDFDIPLAASVAIGDKASDISAAQRAGVPVIVLVNSPKTNSYPEPDVEPTHTTDSLYQAAQWILNLQAESR